MHRAARFCLVAFLILASPILGWAGVIGQNFITVTATNASGTGSWSVPIPDGWKFPEDGTFDWELANPVQIRNATNTATVATIDSMSMNLVEDPQVLLNFATTAGPFATNFTFTSPLLAFAPIVNPDAFATAGLTVTDNADDGATLTGLFPGSKAYRAIYNTNIDWAYLVSPVVAAAEGTALGTERQPLVGRTTIAAAVSNISSEFSFTLTANDSASGTSRFDIIPEPGSLTMIAMSGLLLFRRR